MGTHLSRQQADRLVEWFDHLIIVPDGDKAGLESADRVKETLEGRIARVDIAPMLKGKDADGLPPDTLRAVMGPPF
jgi:DNA primase